MRALALTLASFMVLLGACSEGSVDPNQTGSLGPNEGKLDEGAGDVIGGGDTLGLGDTLELGDTLGLGDTLELGDGVAADGVEAEDPWALAKDVTAHLVVFPNSHKAPEAYQWPQAGHTGFSMGGTEFWQKWAGGESPTFSFSAGSDNGRRCMYASARRFEAIMAVVPENLVILKADSKWSGSFFNWNDDYSGDSWGDGTGARLWAWRTSLVKWISQTNNDGSCYLPTLKMVEDLAIDCLATAEGSDGEIQGCSAREE